MMLVKMVLNMKEVATLGNCSENSTQYGVAPEAQTPTNEANFPRSNTL